MQIVDNVLIKVENDDIPAAGCFIIPDTVKAIGPQAFANCYKLVAVVIPAGVKCIEKETFSSCSNLQSVSLPESLITIAESAFIACHKLSVLMIPQGVTSINSGAFWGCENLTTLNIPKGVTRIEESTFFGCSNLHSVTLPEGLTTIGDNAFGLCENLRSLIISREVITVGHGAFYSCEKLTTLTLHQGVTIGSSAFEDCKKLSIIVVDADTPKALHLVKNQLPLVLKNKVLAKEEYERVQEIQSAVLRATFQELLATNQINPLTTLLSPLQHSFFSLLPNDLLQELNFYRHPTYTSALLKLPELNIEVSRDEHGAINWVDYQTRFKSKFTDVLHTLLASPTTEPSKATRNDILVSNDEPQTFSVTSMPMML